MGLFDGFGGNKQRISSGKETERLMQHIHSRLHGTEAEKERKIAAIRMGFDQAMAINPHRSVIGVDKSEAAKLIASLKANRRAFNFSDDELKSISEEMNEEM